MVGLLAGIVVDPDGLLLDGQYLGDSLLTHFLSPKGIFPAIWGTGSHLPLFGRYQKTMPLQRRRAF
jgi:hypothetical protein